MESVLSAVNAFLKSEASWWVVDLIILYCLLVLLSMGYDHYLKRKGAEGSNFRHWWVWLVTPWVFPTFLATLWFTKKPPKEDE